MAVEEKVRENIPQAEGEAQGVRYISLTEEELDRLMKAAGREGAKKRERQRRIGRQGKEQRQDDHHSLPAVKENEEYIGNRNGHGDRSYAERDSGWDSGAGEERGVQSYQHE